MLNMALGDAKRTLLKYDTKQPVISLVESWMLDHDGHVETGVANGAHVIIEI